MSDTIACDVLVVGSGAGGLSAAVTAAHNGLKVIVAEKAEVFGGTTARSGGWSWVPCNKHAVAAGVDDSLDKAKTYLRGETGNHFDEKRVDAFLANGPKMVEFFENNTALTFELGPAFSDYHPDRPGGIPGGRSIVAAPYDGRELGPEIKRLRPPLAEITFLGMMIGSGRELLHFFNVTRSVKSAGYVAILFAKFLRDKALYGRAMRLTNGNALAGRLGKSALDAGVDIWTSAPVAELIRENGRVVGAIVTRDGKRVRVEVRHGVVLAAGGFPNDVARRKRLFPHAPSGKEHWSPAPESNTGDGIAIGEMAGALTIENYPNAAAWVPVSLVPRSDGTFGPFPHFIDRGKPGVIGVTRKGMRFTNEANSYHDYVQAMVAATRPGEERCSFLIADHPTVRRYGLGFAKPFPVPVGQYVRSGYLVRGQTIEELAKKAGIDAAELVKTVGRFNANAAKGEDPDFHRGSNAYNRYLGDSTHKPNPCVGPIQTGPFYALKLVPGDLGTFAGLATNENAQVLDEHGSVIPGLYASGNDAASVMGGNYPGGGITLGPALTFGFIAGRHLAGVEDAANATRAA